MFSLLCVIEGINAANLSIAHNPFQYSAQYTDKESALQYLNARYYHPEISRFISRDSYQLVNRYAYADGNPINNKDPSGHSSLPSWLSSAGIPGISTGMSAMVIFGSAAFHNAKAAKQVVKQVVTVGEAEEQAELYLCSLMRLGEDLGLMEKPQQSILIADKEGRITSLAKSFEKVSQKQQFKFYYADEEGYVIAVSLKSEEADTAETVAFSRIYHIPEQVLNKEFLQKLATDYHANGALVDAINSDKLNSELRRNGLIL